MSVKTERVFCHLGLTSFIAGLALWIAPLGMKPNPLTTPSMDYQDMDFSFNAHDIIGRINISAVTLLVIGVICGTIAAYMKHAGELWNNTDPDRKGLNTNLS
jgi:hypothetical protein